MRDVGDDKVTDAGGLSFSGGGFGVYRDPNAPRDVSEGRHFYNSNTGTYEWGFPQYDSNGRLVGWDPIVPDSRPARPNEVSYSPESPRVDTTRRPNESLDEYVRRLYDARQTTPFANSVNEANARSPLNPNPIGTSATDSAPAGGNGAPGGVPLALRRLLPLAAGAVAGRSAFGGGGSPTAAPIPPELTELLRMSLQRVRDQEPLFQSITAQARGGLPTAYQRNGGGQ